MVTEVDGFPLVSADLLQILDSIRESVLITDTALDLPGPRILYVNRAFEEVYGYSAEEVIGKTPRIFQGPATSRSVLDELRACLERGQPFTGETINYRKDGSPRTVRWYIEPLVRDGRIHRWLAVQRDVTDQREAERFAGRLLDAMAAFDDGAMLLDTFGAVQFVNEPFTRLLGWASPSDAVGSPAAAVLPLADGQEGFVDSLEHRRRWRGDVTVGAADPMILELSLSPLDGSPASAGGYACTARDVTEQRRAERMSAALSFSDNLGFIFAGIRHELGNPINSLKSALTVLRPNLEKFGPEKVDFYLERALEEVERVEYLLGALKSYGSLTVPSVEDVALDEFIPTLIDLVSRDVEERSTTLTFEQDEGLTVRADPRALHHVLTNLLRNAVEAIEQTDDGGTVQLRAVRRDAWVALTVEDDGEGMTPEQAERAFLPFHTTKGRGTGMGLVIVRRLVSKMGGTLEVQSEAGVGTTMTVLLPAVS